MNKCKAVYLLAGLIVLLSSFGNAGSMPSQKALTLTQVGHWDYEKAAYNVCVDGSYAYLVGENGLTILNVNNPSAITLEGYYLTDIAKYGISGIYAGGDYAQQFRKFAR